MKRIICLLLLICLVLPTTAFAEQHEYIGRMMVVNCKREVSLRAEPTQNSQRLMWVSYHTVLENCRSGYGDYYYVELYDISGYIHGDYLEVYDGPEEIYGGEFYEVMQIVGCPGWTPLREMANVNAKQIAKVPLGAVVYDCEYYADDFTYVNYNGMAGYVLTEYITLGDENIAEPDLSVKYVTNCNAEVSLRAEPTTESERLAWVPKGTAIEALGAKDGYFYVCYEGEYGYIFSDYLANIEYIGTYLGELTVSEPAIMYKEPDINFGELMTIPEGAVVENCYTAHNGYIWVCYNDVYGYVFGTAFKAYGDGLEETEDEPEYIGSMKVVNCEGIGYLYLWEEMGFDSDILAEVPLDMIVTDCVRMDEMHIYGCYDGIYGYMDGYYLEAIEDPYSDADDILSNTRTTLNSMDAGFGVYLVSDSMGGEWSILQEKHHLENVLYGMPEEWWPVVMTMPDERIVEIVGGRHLFLIIPSDEYAYVTVGRLQLGADGFTGNVEEILYESKTGEPFLLRCNVYDFAMDSEIWIVETDGDEYGWYPDVMPTGRIFQPQVEGAAYCDLTTYEEE